MHNAVGPIIDFLVSFTQMVETQFSKDAERSSVVSAITLASSVRLIKCREE